MPRLNYQPLTLRLEQIAPLLKPSGVTRSTIAQAIGVTAKSRMSNIMAEAIERGIAFETFARVSDEMKTPEKVYFPTPEDRDAFCAAYTAEIIGRRKERQRVKSRETYVRNRERYSAERIAQRAAARAERIAKDAAGNAEHMAKRAAQKEIAAQKKRLYREAKAAEAKREKREAMTQQQRLKAETRELGRLAKLKGTSTPKPKAVRGPAMLPGEPFLPPGVEIQKLDSKLHPMGRFAVTEIVRDHYYDLGVSRWAEAVAA